MWAASDYLFAVTDNLEYEAKMCFGDGETFLIGILWCAFALATMVVGVIELATYPIWRPALWAWRKVKR